MGWQQGVPNLVTAVDEWAAHHDGGPLLTQLIDGSDFDMADNRTFEGHLGILAGSLWSPPGS